MKGLLKKVLGQACLNYLEMITVLADYKSFINSRPLMYMLEQESITLISFSMFLKDIYEYIYHTFLQSRKLFSHEGLNTDKL